MYSLDLVKPFIHENKFKLILYTICILLAYPLESIIIPKIFSSFFQNIEKEMTDAVFIFYLKKFLFFIIIINTSQYITSKLDTILIPLFNESISNVFFEKIIKYYQNNYTDLELGKLVTRINLLPSILREITTDLFNWAIPKLFTIIIIICYFFYINILFGIISVLLLFIIIFYNIISFDPCINLALKKYILLEDKSEEIQDKLSNLFSIYSSGKIDMEISEYKNINKEYKEIYRKTINCSNKIKNMNSLIILITFIGLSVLAVYLLKTKKINTNELITIYMILLYYIPCLTTISTYIPDYTNHLGIIKSLNDYIIMVYNTSINKPDIKITNGRIVIKNLTFGYNKDNIIFTNFNLTIDSNEKIGIIGHSGNGKSTLIKLIMGYFKVPDNTIFIDDQDINNYNLNSLRTQISYINQNTKLFNKSIYENIQYGNNLTKNDIDQLFDKFNLYTIFKNHSNLNNKVGVNGDLLSGGQKQILLLLRLYNKQNKILILDEPTSALDNDSKNIIIDIIKKISINSTLIIITHDKTNLELVNHNFIIIENGKIIN